MSNADIIESRVKGQLPLSIATSLAIESLLGVMDGKEPDPNNPFRRYASLAVNAFNKAKQFLGIHVKETPVDKNTAPIADFDELWINFRTLFRNVVGAINANDLKTITANELGYVVMEEVAIIKGVLEDQGFNTEVFLYACTYNNVRGLYREGIMKEGMTPLQQAYAELENGAIKSVIEHIGEDSVLLKQYDTTILTNPKRCVLLSHFPIDLLNIKGARELVLIESHTGKLKRRNQWNTKLKDGNMDISRIPFDRMTIQMFGDKGNLFLAHPKQYRAKLVELSIKYQWTPLTTEQRIKQCVELSREPFLMAAVQKMYF